MDLKVDYGKHGIVLFDGVCNLCNSSVQTVIKYDKKDYFRFAPLQSETGQKLLQQAHLPADFLGTFVYFENGKHYLRSTAALKLSKHLSGLWPLFYVLIVIPAPIRDVFYNLVANNRYKLFGKQEACMIPTPDLMKKFI